MYTDYYVDA